MQIVEMNWYGCKPSEDPTDREPDACYEMSENEAGGLTQGEPCESVSLGAPAVVSVHWTRDTEGDHSVNHCALVRIES